MPKKRVLIVDDSVVIRRSLSEALAREPHVTVAGSASSGRIALLKIPLLHPDVVILDIETSGKGARETLVAIRQAYPELPVIILTVPTERGASAAIDALALGARYSVVKPDAAAGSDARLQILGDEVAAKIASCFAGETDAACRAVARRTARRVDVLAVGVSTGGPSALMELLPRFPAGFPIPIVIVQHMPPTFTRLLADWLASKCSIRVAEGRSDQALLPGSAWIAPGDFHMEVERNEDAVRIRTHQDPRENSCRPAADVLFRSVARVYGPHALALVMTGMGRDGFAGCQAVRAAGGHVLVQDESSSVVWGMPGFIVKAGMADQSVPLGGLAAEIMERVSRHRERQGELVGL